MKHKKFKFLHLVCGKQGSKGKRKLSVEISYQNTEEAYLLGFTIRLIYGFVGFAIEIEKKREEKKYNVKTVSQENANKDSVQGS